MKWITKFVAREFERFALSGVFKNIKLQIKRLKKIKKKKNTSCKREHVDQRAHFTSGMSRRLAQTTTLEPAMT